tara:strand:+ start:2163 stop:2765 length:603 start_codon:yes stop_codon:yes gene_type:complete
MTSEIKVDEIQTSTGSTTLIDTNQEFDQWYLSADDDVYYINNSVLSGWERYSSIRGLNAPMPIGTGLTQTGDASIYWPGSGGLPPSVFTFPRPGYYRIDAYFRFRSSLYDNNFNVALQVSNDSGNNYTNYMRTSFGNGDNDLVRFTYPIKVFINVINSDTTQFLFFKTGTYNASQAYEVIEGGTDEAKTSFSCQRLGPAQ